MSSYYLSATFQHTFTQVYFYIKVICTITIETVVVRDMVDYNYDMVKVKQNCSQTF